MGNEITVAVQQGRLLVALPKFSSRVHGLVRGFPGAPQAWDPQARGWRFAPSPDLWPHLRQFSFTPEEEAALRAAMPPEEAAAGAEVATVDVSDAALAVDDARRAEDAAAFLARMGYVFRDAEGLFDEPFAHQRTATGLAMMRPLFGLFMEMGTGKTRSMVDALSGNILRGRLDGAVITCPLAVCRNWEREVARWSPLPPARRRVAVLVGDLERRLDALARHGAFDFFVLNFEAVRSEAVEAALARVLRSRKMALVLDESTRIKNHAATQTRALLRLGALARARYLLTGTPITQSPMDAYSQLKFLDPAILGHATYASFKAEYAAKFRNLQTGEVATSEKKGRGKKVPVEYKNLDRLAARVQEHSYRKLKSECLDLPPKVPKLVELDMGPRQAALYAQMRDQAVAEMEGRVLVAPLVITRILRLLQIAAGLFPVIDDAGKTVRVEPLEDAPKLPALLELLEEARESDQKTIVWSRFKPDVVRIAEEVGPEAVAFHGGVDEKQRTEFIDRFQRDPACRVFVGQVRTGGIGVTLTAASNVVYFSNSHSLEDRLQSEDRAHRIGQKASSVVYTDLVCRGTVDRLVLRALKEKKSIADIITGDNVREMLAGKEQ